MVDAAGRGRVERAVGNGTMYSSPSYPGSYLRSGGLRQPAWSDWAVFDDERAADDADGGEKGTSRAGVFAEKPDDSVEPKLSLCWRPSSMGSDLRSVSSSSR